jgi:hypothetical protein
MEIKEVKSTTIIDFKTKKRVTCSLTFYRTQKQVLDDNSIFENRFITPCFIIAKDRINKEGYIVKEYAVEEFERMCRKNHVFNKLFETQHDINSYELLYNDLPRKFCTDLDLDDISVNITIDEMIDATKDAIKSLISKDFCNNHVNIDNCMILTSERNNSSSKKSAHLIFQDLKFRNLHETQLFVRLLRHHLSSDDINPKIAEILTKCFDHGIYTKNRLFRMPFQSKLEKQNKLIPLNFKKEDYESILVGIYKKDMEPTFHIDEISSKAEKVFCETSVCSSSSVRSRNYNGVKTLMTTDFQVLDLLIDYQSIPLVEYNTFTNKIDFFLACIPNHESGQHWNLWWSIGQALRNIESSSGNEISHKSFYLDRWISWSSKSNKFNLQQCEEMWNSMKVRGINEPKYKFSFLASLAKYYYSDLFVDNFQKGIRLKELFDIDNSLEVFDKVDQYNQENGFCKKLDLITYKCIVCQAPMGSGKTFQIKSCLKEYQFKRVLIISPRQTFSKEKFAEFSTICNDFLHYKDPSLANPDKLTQTKKLIIQVESLSKFPDPSVTDSRKFVYDLVILDEIESILFQFSSVTHSNVFKAYRVFFQIVQCARHIIMADTFISRRTTSLCQILKNNRYKFDEPNPSFLIKFDKNTHNPNSEHKAIIKAITNSNTSTTESINSFLQNIRDELRRKKKLCVVSASKGFSNSLVKLLLESGLSMGNILVYDSDTSDEDIDNLQNVNEIWSAPEVLIVIYTTKITVGLNFSKRNIFHKIYIFGSIHCPNVRDLLQGHFRIRHTIDKEVIIMMNCFNPNSCFTIKNTFYSDISRYLSSVNQIHADPNEALAFEDIPDAKVYYEMLEKFNYLENMLGVTCYSELFQYFLRQVGYQIIHSTDDNLIDTKQDNTKQIEYEVLYPPSYFKDFKKCKEMHEIEIHMFKDEHNMNSTKEDKQLIDGGFFYHYKLKNKLQDYEKELYDIPQVNDLIKRQKQLNVDLVTAYESELFYLYKNNYSIRRSIDNVVSEINNKDSKEYTQNMVVADKEQICRLKHIKSICSILGIKYSFTLNTLLEEQKIDHVVSYISENPEILRLFNIKSYNCQTFAKKLTSINAIFKFWNGCTIERNSNDKRVGKIIKRFYKPILVYNNKDLYGIYIKNLHQDHKIET